jgi:branched-chain amino acid transport system substrate-binding protein
MDTLAAVRIAVDEVNAKGGINGREVELIAEDGRCATAESVSAAQKLVNVDKVVAIIGGACSSETLAAAPVAAAAKVIVISFASSSPKITGFSPYLFRDYQSDAAKAKSFGKFFAAQGYKSVAIVTENTDFCQGVRTGIKESLGSDTTVAFDEVVEPSTKDYRSLFTRLKDLKFDVLVTNGQTDSTIAEMVKQARALGITQPMIAGDVADSLNLPKIAGEAAEGLRVVGAPALDESSPLGGAFAKAFRAKYGEPKFNLYFAALAYDAANVTMQAIGKSGTDGDKIRQAFLDLKNFDGASGSFHFDMNGDVVGQPAGLKVFKGGTPVMEQLIKLD